MAQKLRDDKIGTLQHSAGNIQMLASLSNPSYLTIGGQQYKITSTLVVALPAMSALARYQVFAVQSGGVVSLVISQNENSVGPAGYTRWKLIGSLMANGLTSVSFGSFLDIRSAPSSDLLEMDNSSFSFVGFGTPVTVTGFIKRNGDSLSGRVYIRSGTTSPADARFSIGSLTFNTNKLSLARRTVLGEAKGYSAVSSAEWGTGTLFQFIYNPTYINQVSISDGYQPVSAEGQPNQVGGDSVLSSGNSLAGWFDNIPISNWTNTPIEDL